MRTFLLVILFFGSPAFSAFESRVHDCQNDKGFKRRVELSYQSSEAALPCRVGLFRGDVKNSDQEIVLMRAKNQTGKCEASEQAYLTKMKKMSVTCTELAARGVAQVEEESESVEATPVAVVPNPEDEDAGAEFRSAPGAVIPASDSDYFERREWEGSYFAGVLGAEFGKSSSKSGSIGYNADDEKWNYDSKGFSGALQMGFNRLWNGLVVGPEFEIGYMGIKGDEAQPTAPGSDTIGKIKSDLFSALRLRVGADFGRNLFFVAAGVIGVNTEASVSDNCNVAPCGGTTMDARKKEFDFGYTVGAGVEHLFKDRWSLKLEYLYFNLGERNFSGVTNLGNSYDWKSETAGSVVRGGLGVYW